MRIGNIELNPVTKNLLFINIILFLASMILGPKYNWDFNKYLAAYFPLSSNFKPYQIISHMFMHANFAHIAFNMFGLFMFGNFLEHFIGSKKFFILYFTAGFGALAFHYAAELYTFNLLNEQIKLAQDTISNFPSILEYLKLSIPEMEGFINKLNPVDAASTSKYTAELVLSSVVGASGAIYGIMAAYAYLFPNTKLIFIFIPYPIKAKYLFPIIIALDLFLGFNPKFGTGIAHFAHVGGAIVGFVVILLFNKLNKKDFY